MTSNQNITNRPVVVLAGWLGCQPRHLRRYTQMYDRMGWQSLIRIGSPRSVIAAMTEGPSSCCSSSSVNQSLSSSSSLSSQSEMNMKELAMDTLQELQKIQPPYFVLHVFSNNGCFLWEWIRFLLLGQDSSSSSGDSDMIDIGIDIVSLRRKLIGVMFDSAPAHYGGKADTIQLALQYVTPETERNQLLDMAKALDANVVKRRFDEFWNGLLLLRNDNDNTNDSTSTMCTTIPEMYLYSQCDNLASAEHLEKLIAYREDHQKNSLLLRKDNVNGKGVVWKHNFLDSEHCGHLVKYPKEYNQLIDDFLRFCTGQRMSGNYLENEISMRSRL